MKVTFTKYDDIAAILRRLPLIDPAIPYSPPQNWFHEILKNLPFDAQNKLTETSSDKYVRLGTYFEQLWAELLTIHPRYRLISHNKQVQYQGKTLGAFDFLVQDMTDRQHEHWELTVKFYLEVIHKNKPVWLGANLNDDWESKRRKLLSKQIQLSEHIASQTLLQELGIKKISQKRIIAKGLIFKQSNLPSDRCWITYSDWSQFRDNYDWFGLPKQTWFNPAKHPDKSQFNDSKFESPGMFWGINGQQFVQCFVVPDNWHKRARVKAEDVFNQMKHSD